MDHFIIHQNQKHLLRLADILENFCIRKLNTVHPEYLLLSRIFELQYVPSCINKRIR